VTHSGSRPDLVTNVGAYQDPVTHKCARQDLLTLSGALQDLVTQSDPFIGPRDLQLCPSDPLKTKYYPLGPCDTQRWWHTVVPVRTL
jgi:hypothetical protein